MANVVPRAARPEVVRVGFTLDALSTKRASGESLDRRAGLRTDVCSGLGGFHPDWGAQSTRGRADAGRSATGIMRILLACRGPPAGALSAARRARHCCSLKICRSIDSTNTALIEIINDFVFTRQFEAD